MGRWACDTLRARPRAVSPFSKKEPGLEEIAIPTGPFGVHRTMHRLALLFVVALTACSAAGVTPQGTSDAGGAAADATTDGDVPCQPPPGFRFEPPPSRSYCVREIRGRVQDTSAKPIFEEQITVCGLACFAGLSDATGAFRIKVNAFLPDDGYVIFAHGRPHHSGLFLRLPKAPPETIELARPIELAPLSKEGVPLPADDGPASTVRVGPLSFGVQAGTTWELSLEDVVAEGEGRKLRFARVPVAQAPAFASGAVLVYALAPFQARASRSLSLSIDEAGGLPPGSAVDLVVMEDGIVSADNTGGLPRVAAKGHVSEDGKRVQTDPGQGIDLLTWLAIRPSR